MGSQDLTPAKHRVHQNRAISFGSVDEEKSQRNGHRQTIYSSNLYYDQSSPPCLLQSKRPIKIPISSFLKKKKIYEKWGSNELCDLHLAATRAAFWSIPRHLQTNRAGGMLFNDSGGGFFSLHDVQQIFNRLMKKMNRKKVVKLLQGKNKLSLSLSVSLVRDRCQNYFVAAK